MGWIQRQNHTSVEQMYDGLKRRHLSTMSSASSVPR